MFDISPSSYTFAGKDIAGQDAYSITLQLERRNKETLIKSLDVKIYDEELSVNSEVLRQAVNPHIAGIGFTNDAGVNGSYIYIDVPFGPTGSCREAREHKLTKSIHITNLGAGNSKKAEARIHDPCEKP